MLLDIKENGQYKNIDLKQHEKIYVEEADTYVKKWVLNGQSITLEKSGDGKLIDCKGKDGKTWKSGLCFAKYEDEEVSFFLTEKLYDVWKAIGEDGSLIKVSGEAREFNGNKYLALNLELAE